MTMALNINKMDTGKKVGLFVLSAVALAVLPFLVGGVLGNSWVRIVDFALLYVMLALGLNIVVGFAGLLDLGFIAFYAVGAYAFALLGSPHFGLHLPFYISIPLGAVLAAFCGILLGTPVLRLKGDYLAIVTLGFGEIVRIFMNNLNTPVNITNGPQGINLIDPIKVGGVSLGDTMELFGLSFHSVYLYYYLFLVLTVGVVIMAWRLQHSRIGRAWVALREDDIAAAAMGINIRNIKLLAFALGALSGGVAGGLFASFQGFVSPESFSLLESIMILAMIVLGGMGHIPGDPGSGGADHRAGNPARRDRPVADENLRQNADRSGKRSHAVVRPGNGGDDAGAARRHVAVQAPQSRVP